MTEFFLKFFLTVMAVIVIILVLLQKGKGGGLAGALGGAGGQSAFGTKAGDFFTKVTIVVARSELVTMRSAISEGANPSYRHTTLITGILMSGKISTGVR